jgi:hypothetical protein
VPTEKKPELLGPDDLITPEVVVQLLGYSSVKQVQRDVARGRLTPYAYVSSLNRHFMVFRRSYIEGKKEKLEALRAAEEALTD